MKKSEIRKMVKEELQSQKLVESKKAPKQKGILVFYKDDFKNAWRWYSILDTFGIKSGEAANWDEPKELDLWINKVKYD